MTDFSPPSMPDARPSDPADARMPLPAEPAHGPGPMARLVALIVSVGLAWAIALALTAWLLGLFLSRG